MKALLLFLFLIFGSLIAKAQSITKQVVGSSGASITNGTNTMNFTIGESIVGMVQNGVTINQGFWAELSNDGTLSVSAQVESSDFIKLYPNPVVNYLQIHFKKNESIRYDAALFDINGKQIFQTKITSQVKNNQLDISHLSSGIYVLSISSTETNYQNSFKIIKK